MNQVCGWDMQLGLEKEKHVCSVKSQTMFTQNVVGLCVSVRRTGTQ